MKHNMYSLNIDMDVIDYNDVYCLYKAVQEEKPWGCFDVATINGKLIVKHSDDNPLILASPKEKNICLNLIQKLFCKGSDIEGYYVYHKAMEKAD